MNVICIVGLGNPGAEYSQTRHNIGWLVTDALLDTPLTHDKKHNAALSRGKMAGQDVLVVQPQTYMNKSGHAVRSVAQYYDIPDDRVWLVHDEIDLPFGQVRISMQRSAAGHRGVQSVYDQLGTQALTRFRIGIRPAHTVTTESYVMQAWNREQSDQLPAIISRTKEIIQRAVETSPQQAAAEYN